MLHQVDCGFLNNFSKSSKSYNNVLIFMCVSAIFLSQISFSTFVNLLYPVLGFFGIWEIGTVMFSGLRCRKI